MIPVLTKSPRVFMEKKAKANGWKPNYSLVNELEPLLKALKMLCGMPIMKDEEDNFHIAWKNISMLFSGALYGSMTIMTILVFHRQIVEYDLYSDTKENLAFYVGSALLSLFHLVPILLILETKKLKEYLESWKVAEDIFWYTSGKRLKLKLKQPKRVILTSGILMSFGITGYVVYSGLERNKNQTTEFIIMHVATMTYHLVVVALSGSLWTLANLALQRFADAIIFEMQHTTYWGISEGEAVRKLANLWLQLRNLTSGLADSLAYTGTYFMLSQFLINVSALYNTTLKVTNGGFLSGDTLSTIVSVLFLAYVSEVSHKTIVKVGSEFQDLVMERRNNTLAGGLAAKEWRRFHEFIVMHPPSMSMAGYITLDRGINVSILGSYVTYVVIFMQMNASSNNNIQNGQANTQ